jgi:hypothetical protein
LIKHKIKIENISNKRRGIVNKDKYVLFSDMPDIYLKRIHKKWVYSAETVSKISDIYDSYVLKKSTNNFGLQLKQALSTVNKTSGGNNSKGDSNTNKNQSISKTDTENNTEVKASKVRKADGKDTYKGVKLDLSTPYNTIVSHLLFLEDSLFNPELAAKTIHFTDKDTNRAEELAIKLKQIYLAAPHEVFKISELSTDSFYVDSATQKHLYWPNPIYPELYLEKVGDNWLYSTATSKLINSVHKDLYDDAEAVFKFSDKFKKLAGSDNKVIFYDIKTWQFYMFMYFIIILLIVKLFNVFVVKRVVNRLFRNNKYREYIYKIFSIVTITILYYLIESYIPSF